MERRDVLNGIGMTSQRTRQRMVRRLQAAGIGSEAVLEAIMAVPRHLFVDEALASRAYEDTALPIGLGQTISQPLVVARMTEAILGGRKPRQVLEIGTGSAYQTAVLATLADRVYSVERISQLLERARHRLRALGIRNVRLKYADGTVGWPERGPFDAILLTAAAPALQDVLLDQLAIGGRLVAPVGSGRSQQLVLVERTTIGFERRSLGPVSFVPLLGGVL